MPSEYSQSVIGGVKLSLDEQLASYLGSGVILINQAAHGEVGSSNNFFKQITIIVMQLLVLDSAISPKKVAEIFNNFSLV